MPVRRIVVITFAVWCLIYQAWSSWSAISREWNERERCRRPFGFNLYDDKPYARAVRLEAAAAGVREGDLILRVNGEALTGLRPFVRALEASKPGEVLRVTLADGRVAAIRLEPIGGASWYWVDWIYAVELRTITPWFGLLLALFVVWRRPHDIAAYLLWGLMVGYSMNIADGNSRIWESANAAPAWFSHALTFHQAVFWSFSTLFLVPLALVFPGGSIATLRHPLVVAYLVPASVYALASSLMVTGTLTSLEWIEPLNALWRRTSWARVLTLFPPLAFFLGRMAWIGWRGADADARRRARLLLAGMTLAVVPNVALDYFGRWFPVPPALRWLLGSLTLLLPATLAYVIVVDKAMDVAVTVREGLQYAVARRGLQVLQAAVGLAVMFFLAFAVEGQPLVDRLGIVAAGLAVASFAEIGAQRLTRWIDRRFFRDAHQADELLVKLSRDVGLLVETEPIIETVTRTVAMALKPSRVSLLLNPVTPAPGDLALPLRRFHRQVGTLVLGPKQSGDPYAPSDLRLLQSVADQTALALDNSLLASRVAAEAAELAIARDVQQRLLPKELPSGAGFVFTGASRPAKEIGGDSYDAVMLAGGRVMFSIADVAGKGVAAALVMASLQASLRAQAGQRELAAIVASVNQYLYDTTPRSRFVTLFVAVLDPASGVVEYVNAGHNPPLLRRAGGGHEWLKPTGVATGLSRKAKWSPGRVELQPGDVLITYTDGITEARDRAGEEFGEDRLLALTTPAVEEMLDAVERFADGAPQHDDMTLLRLTYGDGQ